MFFILSDLLKLFSIRKNVVLYVFVFFDVSTHRVHSLKSVSGPCSIEKVYPREWQIAIPASLMRVDMTHIVFVLWCSGKAFLKSNSLTFCIEA